MTRRGGTTSARIGGTHPVAHRAFTLLEMIVALAIVVILAAALVASMRVAFKAKQACETATDNARTADLVFDLLRNDLTNATPRGDYISGEMTGTDNGTVDDLVLYTTATAPERAAANGDVKMVEWTIDKPTNGITNDDCLLRRVTRNLLSDVDQTPDEQVVCRGVTGLNFRYFDGTDWQDSWASSEQGEELPMAVEVTVEIDPSQMAGAAAATPGAQPQTVRYVRVFRVPCSNLSASGLTGGAP